MNYLKYFRRVLLVMSWLCLHIRTKASRVGPTSLKQDPALFAKLLKRWADSPQTLLNPSLFGARLWPTLVLTRPSESFPVAGQDSLVLKVSTQHLVGSALPGGCDAAPFAIALRLRVRSWA